MHWWDSSNKKYQIEQWQEEAKQNGLLTHRLSRKISNSIVHDLLVCQNAKLDELFNMNDLHEDYLNSLSEEEFYLFSEEFNVLHDRHLSYFFDNWDYPEMPLWIVGLILGYPIENTISIYRQ